jgi:hypothetical protein
MDELDLSHLLADEPGPEPTPDALEAVLRRHRRAGVRTLVGALAVTLVAAPIGGFLIARATESGSGGGGGGDGTVATAAASTSGSSSAAIAPSVAGSLADVALAELGAKFAGGKLSHLFDRTVDGVTIRAYAREIKLPSRPANAPAVPAACVPTGALVAEMSTKEAVGQGMAVAFPSSPATGLDTVRIGIFGAAEGAPVAWAIGWVDGSVKTVRLLLPDGTTDEATPDHGWVVLAHHMASTTEPKKALDGTKLEALDGSGKVVTSNDGSIAIPAECKSALRGRFRPDGPPKRRPGAPASTPTTIATR